MKEKEEEEGECWTVEGIIISRSYCCIFSGRLLVNEDSRDGLGEDAMMREAAYPIDYDVGTALAVIHLAALVKAM